MDRHATRDELAGLNRGLPPEQTAAVLDHLARCSRCAAAAREVVPIDGELVGQLLEAGHPDPERELFAFVDGTLDPAATAKVARHLDECGLCREDVEELRALRPTLQTMPHEDARPRPRARWIAAAAAVIAVGAATTFFTRDDARAPQISRPVAVPAAPAEQPPRAGELPAAWIDLVQQVQNRGALEPPALLLATEPVREQLRGAPDSRSRILGPAAEVVESARPEFRWTAVAGATYVVSVFEGDRLVATSGPLSGTSWQPDRDLARGAVHAWEVEARRGGTRTIIPTPPDPPARFAIAGARELAAIDDARRARPDDHLLLTTLYARAGLRGEAERVLQRWSREQPDAALPRQLLTSLRDWPTYLPE